MRRPTPLQKRKAGEAFIAATEALVRRLTVGLPVHVEAHGIVSADGSIKALESWKVPTIYGQLSIHPYENWIACRFSEVERLRRDGRDLDPAPNFHSGKWNFHFGPIAVPEQLPYFEHHLQKILPAA